MVSKDKRPFYKTKTFWGCAALFIAGGLDAIGLGGYAGTVQQLAAIIGLPLTAYGVADRLKK
jgi:dolichol kinase